MALSSFFGGCSTDAENCARNNMCLDDGTPVSGGGVVVPPGCAALPSADANVIRDDCAYFVGGMNANDSNAGGEVAPFATLAKALEAAKTSKGRVYLCGNAPERVEIPGGVSVFGGFDCEGAEWVYDETKRGVIAPPAPTVDDPFQSSVRISGSGNTSLEDVNIQAADAMIDGGSSIAVIVDQAAVTFARVDLTAGNGANGAKGATPTDDIGPMSAMDPLIAGNNGENACMGGSSGNPGGEEKANPSCSDSIGGTGGIGKDLMAAEGGAPGSPMLAGSGAAGTGEDAAQCTPGGAGANGKTGSSGKGATEAGTIDVTGYAGRSGAAAGKGTVGQGGGGGGGAKGKMNCNGASGGSGGAGGCAGNGGLGGTAGGSSIGIIHLGGTLSFSSVKIVLGNGGAGGDGGDGQTGATGGNGGLGGEGAKNAGQTPFGCDGGKGGRGGNGGLGGGGHGGHSLGIAVKKGGSAPNTTMVDIKIGMSGAGGVGDASAMGNGAPGVASNVQELD